MGKILLFNIKIKFKIWRVTIFAQETIYHVRTEMRQSLVYADLVLRYSETCL